MVTVPLMVLFYDRTFVSGSINESLKKHRELYLGLAATWLILFALLSIPNESSSSAGFDAITVHPIKYLVTQAGVVIHYIKLVFWPVDLCLDYDWPPAEISFKTFAQSGIIILFILFFSILTLKRNLTGFTGLSFFILLAPSSSIIPLSDCAAEHRMYLPLILVIVLTCMAVYWIFRKLSNIFILGEIYWLIIIITVTICITISLTLVTIKRNKMYQSEKLMWQQVVSICPDNLRAHLGVGSVFLRNNQSKEAEPYFMRILNDVRFTNSNFHAKYATELSMAYNNLGVIRFQEGKYNDAEKYFKEALALGFSIDAQRNLRLAGNKGKEQKQCHK
jgi:tetratricopeptide (TPR) repeat protein